MNFRRVVGIFSVVSTIMSFYACGDDKSSSANSLPDEVADKAELETYECNMSVIGGKVFVKSLGKNYECDGEEWFESYDQPKSSAKGKSSSSSKGKSSSSGKASSSSSEKVSSSSSSAVEQLSSSVMSSSSRPTEILEPEIKVNERCSETGACDAMDKNDVGTWHFVRKDDFGDDAEYTYKADGRDLIVTIKSADGSVDSKTYSMYNMESEVGVEMAFNAAKSTCKDGGGNDKKIKTCVKDTTEVLPECDREHEGYLALIGSVYKICKSKSWTKATVLEYDTYGLECLDDGRAVCGNVIDSNKYVCESGKFREANFFERDTYGFECVEGRTVAGRVNEENKYTCELGKFREANKIEIDTYGLECVEGQTVAGNVNKYNRYTCESGRFRTANEFEIHTYGLECVEGLVVKGSEFSSGYYVCKSGKFVEAADDERSVGLACMANNEGQIAEGRPVSYSGPSPLPMYKYYCSNQEWKNITNWDWNVSKEIRFNPEVKYGSMIDDRDGRVYRTVKIDEQVWMAENLNYSDSIKTPSLKGRSSCYDNKDEYCEVAGRLYTWAAAFDSVARPDLAEKLAYCERTVTVCDVSAKTQGVCPKGWHLPDTTEWINLLVAVGGGRGTWANVRGAEFLKSRTGWSDSGTQNFDDAFGFSMLPAGWWDAQEGYLKFDASGFYAYFWEVTGRHLVVGSGAYAWITNGYKKSMMSVRCVKDE